MELHQIRLPAVTEYVAAFRAVEPRITDGQRALLLAHHAAQARTLTATRLAEIVGWSSYTAVNAQYGTLAGHLARALDIDLSGDVQLGVLVEFVDPGYAANEQYLWVLRPNVARALEELGWAPRVSHLLYPHLAIEAGA